MLVYFNQQECNYRTKQYEEVNRFKNVMFSAITLQRPAGSYQQLWGTCCIHQSFTLEIKVAGTYKMVETTYQNTKYITDTYMVVGLGKGYHNPKITIKTYSPGTHTHQALLTLETVLQELALLWLASLGPCISSPPFSIVFCLTQLHLPLSNIT